MRIKRLSITGDGQLRIYFGDTFILVDLPAQWINWNRQQKIAWAKQWLSTHLQDHIYQAVEQTVFPDPAAIDTAKDDFENLPGWATWTPVEAETWIETNVTDLASAKTVLIAMAKAILYLRNIGIEQ